MSLPPGSIPASEFNVSEIPPSFNLFFDDDLENINDVQKAANGERENLLSVYCPPGPIVLYDARGTSLQTNPADYIHSKSRDQYLSGDFRNFLKKHTEKKIGNGITPDMIRQIIAYEETPLSQEFKRLYFFDFDMLLSQINGLCFAFFNDINDDADLLLNQYAKYLFSDHIGPEPENGRLRLLTAMFRAIGDDRIYVITSNPFANQEIRKKNGEMGPNIFLKYFVGILRILLPTFIPNHLVCTNPNNEEPLYHKKSDAIMDVLKARKAMSEPEPEPELQLQPQPQPQPKSVIMAEPESGFTFEPVPPVIMTPVKPKSAMKPAKSVIPKPKSVKSAIQKSIKPMPKPKSKPLQSATRSTVKKRGGAKRMKFTRRKR